MYYWVFFPPAIHHPYTSSLPVIIILHDVNNWVVTNFTEGLLCRLILVAPKPDLGTLSAVVCTTVVVDLWARHLSIAVKAFLAIVSVPEGSRGSEGSSGAGGGSNSNSSGLCGRGRLAGCGHSSYRCRRRLGCLRRGGGTEGWGGLRRSPHPRGGGSSVFDTDDNTRGDGSGGSSNARGDGVNGTRFSGGVRRVWRACLCFSERFCGGPFRLWCRPTSGSDGDGGIGGRQDGRADAADIRRAGVLLSRAGRQARHCQRQRGAMCVERNIWRCFSMSFFDTLKVMTNESSTEHRR